MLWGHLEADAKPLPNLPDVAVVGLNQTLQQTALAGQYTEEREKTFLEGVNTLYVAFTRPRHRLYVLSKLPEAKKSAKSDSEPGGPGVPAVAGRTVADLLHGYLLGLGQWQDEQISFVLSRGSQAMQNTGFQQSGTSTYFLTNLTTAPWEERLRLRRHAATVFDFDEQQCLGEWNRKLHHGLRRLLTAADVPRVAGQLVAEGIISAKERNDLAASLERIVNDVRLAPYFAPHLSVETEREILVGGVQLRPYKPDRVVLDRTGRHVTLLDFRLPPPREVHRQSMRSYATLFEQLGYEKVTGLIYYFQTGEIVLV